MRGIRSMKVLIPASVGVLTLGAAVFTPSLASAQDPSLPIVSKVGLVQNMLSAKAEPFAGSVVATSNLFGSLSSLVASHTPGVTLPEGTTTAKIWKGKGKTARIQVLNSSSERDLYVNGSSSWLWSSSGMTALHVVGSSTPAMIGGVPSSMMNPSQLASSILSQAGPYINLTLGHNTYIGGVASYQLVVQPSSSASLIASVHIFVDASNWHVLGVEVFSKSESSPVLSVEFSSIKFGLQPSAVFQFTPPPGAKISTKVLKGTKSTRQRAFKKGAMKNILPQATNKATVLGSGWDQVLVTPPGSYAADLSRLGATYAPLLKSTMTSYETPFGVGKVLSTPLLNIMVLPNGQMIAGAVSMNQLAIDATLGYRQ